MNLETENRTPVRMESEQGQQIEVVIFDMDGTLYQLDGEENGFSGSSIEGIVLENTRQYIIDREGCSALEAENIINLGLQDPIGLSNFLAIRYSITRTEYFDVTWDIDPEGIVRNYEKAVEAVKQLLKSNKRLILLTSAPRVWQSRVLEFLELEDCFSEVYSAEDFGRKEEIFERLNLLYEPANILSIGDQLTTDIEPAERLGMRTFLVNNPTDLTILVSKERRIDE